MAVLLRLDMQRWGGDCFHFLTTLVTVCSRARSTFHRLGHGFDVNRLLAVLNGFEEEAHVVISAPLAPKWCSRRMLRDRSLTSHTVEQLAVYAFAKTRPAAKLASLNIIRNQYSLFYPQKPGVYMVSIPTLTCSMNMDVSLR